MKNKIILLGSFLLIGAFSLSAMQRPGLKMSDDYMAKQEMRMQKLEDHLQVESRYYDYLPSLAANCYITADALVWAVNNRGWPYYIQIEPPGDPYEWNFKYRKLHFDPGFRVGFGFKTRFDWDAFFGYTFFHSTLKEQASSDDGLFGLYFGLPFQTVKTKYEMDYDMIDLEIGRPFHAGKYLAFKPYFGARGGWIDQKGVNDYEGEITPPPFGIEDTVPAKNRFREKMWMIGPRAGMDGDFFFGKTGISIWGKLAGALLYLETDNYLELFATDVATSGMYLRNRITQKYSDLKATLQLACGLAWGDLLDDDQFGLSIRAGWEANYWWNQFHESIFLRRVELSPIGVFEETRDVFVDSQAMIIQGFTCSIRFDF